MVIPTIPGSLAGGGQITHRHLLVWFFLLSAPFVGFTFRMKGQRLEEGK